ncbi:MAG: hypothetical protein JST22_04990 [Bacteroidetes bacterium]|nr:hypothetical protein [Bacteroidota bacterium]
MMLPNGNTSTIRFSLSGLLFVAMMLLATVGGVHAQDSPCNQGRAVSPRVDPRYSGLICVPEIGRYNGVLPCRYGTEAYGNSVVPIGPLLRQGPLAWVLSRVRCDTLPEASEVLLYRAMDGTLPSVESGERIGPREVLANVHFLAAGDWDNSGTTDLCCYIQIYGDSSAGANPKGYEYGYVVVFWSDSLGHYSIDDTTQLACDADRWGGVQGALGTDRNNDGIDDLFIVDYGAGFSHGAIVEQDRERIYLGHNRKQWGRNAGRVADWRSWGGPPLTELSEIDQDGDGIKDIVFYSNTHTGTGSLTILYGRSSGLPDTNELETVDLQITNGHASRLMDISNDGIPELVVHCGSLEQLAIFVGIKGQRIVEQFGPGLERLDTNRPPERWWTKPFARVWLPYRINDAWPGSTWEAVYDLGDANGDGYRDIWIHCRPYLLCYSSGPALDSLVDAIVDYRPAATLGSARSLGKILGNGEPPVFGIGLSNGIIYAHPDNEIPARSEQVRRWPDGTLGPRLGASDNNGTATPAARLDVIPNPSGSDVELRWNRDVEGTLIVTDVAGREVLHTHIDRAAHSYLVPCAGLVPGIYFALLRDAHAALTTQIVIQ